MLPKSALQEPVFDESTGVTYNREHADQPSYDFVWGKNQRTNFLIPLPSGNDLRCIWGLSKAFDTGLVTAIDKKYVYNWHCPPWYQSNLSLGVKSNDMRSLTRKPCKFGPKQNQENLLKKLSPATSVCFDTIAQASSYKVDLKIPNNMERYLSEHSQYTPR
jgi:hypothetical protein